MKEEIWKYVEGFGKKYMISNLGRVKSFYRKDESILRDQLRRGGYRGILLTRNKKQYNMLIHRLVAIAFIENPLNKKDINHINYIRDCNCVDNLEWVTHQENITHSMLRRRKKK